MDCYGIKYLHIGVQVKDRIPIYTAHRFQIIVLLHLKKESVCE